jgi:hypothetical protein
MFHLFRQYINEVIFRNEKKLETSPHYNSVREMHIHPYFEPAILRGTKHHFNVLMVPHLTNIQCSYMAAPDGTRIYLSRLCKDSLKKMSNAAAYLPHFTGQVLQN